MARKVGAELLDDFIDSVGVGSLGLSYGGDYLNQEVLLDYFLVVFPREYLQRRVFHD